MGRAFVIGAGMAGLSAAVHIARQGVPVTLLEGAGQAGGRCRSFHDEKLDCLIDNGNHLMLSGNWALMEYLRAIDAVDNLTGPAEAAFPFVDLADGARWTVRMNRGPIPWWLLSPQRRVAGTGLGDYWAMRRLLTPHGDNTVADLVNAESPLYRRFVEPLSVAVLNAAPSEAAASLLRPVLTETFLRGGRYCRPLIAREGLSQCLVDPALAYLRAKSADIRLNCRVSSISLGDHGVQGIQAADRAFAVTGADRVILATPAATAARLIPDLDVPTAAAPIVNIHFRLDHPVEAPGPILGVIGGDAQWLFFRDQIISVTISAADKYVSMPAEIIAQKVWNDVRAALMLDFRGPPAVRVIKEKRATFRQTPAALARRPKTRTRWPNLMLAGDWTATGLPATIEGAVRSGRVAARLAVAGRSAS